MKNKITFFCLALLISCGPLFAKPLTNKKVDVEQERMYVLENHLQIDTRYYDYLESYKANCYLNLDILIWSAINRGWPYCFQLKSVSDDIGQLHTKYPSLHYDPGFRLGFGMKTSLDWDIFLNWTRFHPSFSETKSDAHGLVAAYAPAPFQRAKIKWELDYDLIDMEIGRPFHVGKYIAMRPFVSLRGGQLDQKGTLKFDEPLPVAQPLNETVPANADFKEDVWVIGPRLGLDLDFFMGMGFSIYGNLAGALLYGEADYRLRATRTIAATGHEEGFLDIDGKFSDLEANLQIGVGLSWGGFVHKDKVAFCIKAGWEANYWWDQFNEPIYFTSGSSTFSFYNNRPTILQGGVISFRLDF